MFHVLFILLKQLVDCNMFILKQFCDNTSTYFSDSEGSPSWEADYTFS
jgi:hypothetical protein